MKNTRLYYIELYRYPYPDAGNLKFRVHVGSINRDALLPDMVALIGPVKAHNREEAVAMALQERKTG